MEAGRIGSALEGRRGSLPGSFVVACHEEGADPRQSLIAKHLAMPASRAQRPEDIGLGERRKEAGGDPLPGARVGLDQGQAPLRDRLVQRATPGKRAIHRLGEDASTAIGNGELHGQHCGHARSHEGRGRPKQRVLARQRASLARAAGIEEHGAKIAAGSQGLAENRRRNRMRCAVRGLEQQ